MTKNKSLGKEIYEGAGEFGHIEAWIGAIFASIIGLFFLIIGIIGVSRKSSLTSNTEGKITDVNCSTPYNDNGEQKYNCTVSIEYTVDNKQYSITKTITDNFQHYKGESITVYYNPNTPGKAETNSDNSKIVGVVFIIVGLIIPAFAWLWLWITYKSKFAAAAGGVAGAINLIKN